MHGDGNGSGGLSLTPTATYVNNVNAGTATASYNYPGDANYEASSDTKTFTIAKAPTVDHGDDCGSARSSTTARRRPRARSR